MRTPTLKEYDYHRGRPLTDRQGNVLAAVAQGWPFEWVRQHKSIKTKQGSSVNQVRRQAYYGLIILGVFDVPNAEVRETQIQRYLYDRADWVAAQVGVGRLDAYGHNDTKDNRKDRALYLAILRRALNGQTRVETAAELGVGINHMNTALQFWRECIGDMYLYEDEHNLVGEQFRYWKEYLGAGTEDLVDNVVRDWPNPHERADAFYRRQRSCSPL